MRVDLGKKHVRLLLGSMFFYCVNYGSKGCQASKRGITKLDRLLVKSQHAKILFTDHCRWQNFCPSLLRLVDRLYTVIHKTQKTRTKVLPSATTGE